MPSENGFMLQLILRALTNKEEEEEEEVDCEARPQEISQQYNKLLSKPNGLWELIIKVESIENQEKN